MNVSIVLLNRVLRLFLRIKLHYYETICLHYYIYIFYKKKNRSYICYTLINRSLLIGRRLDVTSFIKMQRS